MFQNKIINIGFVFVVQIFMLFAMIGYYRTNKMSGDVIYLPVRVEQGESGVTLRLAATETPVMDIVFEQQNLSEVSTMYPIGTTVWVEFGEYPVLSFEESYNDRYSFPIGISLERVGVSEFGVGQDSYLVQATVLGVRRQDDQSPYAPFIVDVSYGVEQDLILPDEIIKDLESDDIIAEARISEEGLLEVSQIYKNGAPAL